MSRYIDFKVRPVVKWHGGKAYLARRIVDLLPAHRVYVEPFAGGLNVLLNKYKSEIEVAGDLNPELIHLYQVVVSHTEELLRRISETPYSEESFKRAVSAVGIKTPDPVERALNFLIKHRMSRGGIGKDFSKATDPAKIAFWSDLPEDLIFTANRLKDVQFFKALAWDLIERFDGPDTLFYLDPPYYPSTRTVPDVYEFEMSHMDHVVLLKKIKSCQGSLVLSGYSNPFYNQELKDWVKYEFEMANHSSQEKSKSRRVECLWVKEKLFWVK